jgi:hypothetical protein
MMTHVLFFIGMAFGHLSHKLSTARRNWRSAWGAGKSSHFEFPLKTSLRIIIALYEGDTEGYCNLKNDEDIKNAHVLLEYGKSNLKYKQWAAYQESLGIEEEVGHAKT